LIHVNEACNIDLSFLGWFGRKKLHMKKRLKKGRLSMKRL
jgi:hypothetical protein